MGYICLRANTDKSESTSRDHRTTAILALRPNVREVRKVLAVKLVYQGYLYEEVQTILDVLLGLITGWKQAYEQDGINGLRPNHKGRKSYLSSKQREEVLSWLQTKDC